jgi:uncharacterized protein YqjF (DUF2071 family)
MSSPSLPAGPQLRPQWAQQWLDVLFLHWPVPSSVLSARLPAGVELDTYEGVAWLGLVLFGMRVRPRWLPYLPCLSFVTEVNLRTYVRHQGRGGVCFLSLHADNCLAVRLARHFTPLPYFHARMHYRHAGAESSFESHTSAHPDCTFSLAFRTAPDFRQPPGSSLDAWLVERYRVFAACPRRGLMEAQVTHPPWLIEDVILHDNPSAQGPWTDLGLSWPPVRAAFSRGVEALFGRFDVIAP